MLRSVTSRMDHAYEKLHTDCGAWTCVRVLGVDDNQVSLQSLDTTCLLPSTHARLERPGNNAHL